MQKVRVSFKQPITTLFKVVIQYIYAHTTVGNEILAGENFGKFGETNIVRQYFTQPTRFSKVTIC